MGIVLVMVFGMVGVMQDEATAYEKAVFDAVSYLISEDRDDELALELHTKVPLFNWSFKPS